MAAGRVITAFAAVTEGGREEGLNVAVEHFGGTVIEAAVMVGRAAVGERACEG